MPRHDRAEETRQRLIAAGMRLFARDGYEAVTTRQLAEAAAVNQAAIPYHFGGKEGVYLAVAEHIASAAGARVQALAASVQARLPAADQTAVRALLLEATVAVAEAIFATGDRGVWALFLAREQFHPSPAFAQLYAAFVEPVHALIGALIARLTGSAADAVDSVMLTHAYLGQILAFTSAHATLERRLGQAAGDDTAATLAAIRRFSGMAIAGMGAGRDATAGVGAQT
ncbi:CerR family C-terminal domain-containing protein [Massilia sp. TS11]|uniref:CerR family C-terminal domain-containing protein n=1 Tax=Massilia sp. TS11 TaxID=2908003 RepID=UPI001EDC2E47|nr:CerR family C-terminal domain-containing protein [Massilia sp. TS11]MCG2586352.1 CerR family C-terminal domain-containing protein [Massilia sp. TS11]